MKVAICLLLFWIQCRAEMVVATVGDSFADALYLAMKVRTNLLKERDIRLVRWSRANVGFTRLDSFDYPAWLRDNSALGQADLCVVHIGSNDLQSIRTGRHKWAYFGSDSWKELYGARVASMLETLEQTRCKQVVWFLQPAFERSRMMSRGKVPVNHVQAKVVSATSAVAFDILTGVNDYQADNIHYGRALMLRAGPALLEVADAARQMIEGGCRSCHGLGVAEQVFRARDLLPLRVQERR